MNLAGLRTPLADVGALPPDLLAAFNGAVHAASLANGMVCVLGGGAWTAPCEAEAGSREIVVSALKGLYDNANYARESLARVAGVLNVARGQRGPAHFGTWVRPNA